MKKKIVSLLLVFCLLVSLAPAALAEGEDADTGATRTITVNYVYKSNSGMVAQPYSAEVSATEDFVKDIAIPSIANYTPEVADTDPLPDGVTLDVEAGLLHFNLAAAEEDVTIVLYYVAGQAQYTVIHRYQNLEDDDYTEEPPVYVTGDIDAYTQAVAQNKEGFTCTGIQQSIIAADGTTQVVITYDRNYYTVVFDVNGGVGGPDPIYAKYGTEYNVDDITSPTRVGYSFAGWKDDDDNTPSGRVTGNVTYKAQWQATAYKAGVTFVIWGQNANDDEYSYLQSVPGEGIVGDTISWRTLTCGKEEHTHDESCYGLICGFPEDYNHPSHTEECLTCPIPEHTHTAECCEKEEHTHDGDCCVLPVHSHTPSECCSLEEHTHSDSCCKYGGTSLFHWQHSDNCCSEGKSEHTHSSSYDRRSSCNTDKCGLVEHTHGDGNCTCAQEAHTHGDGNCICPQEAHTHSDAQNCYIDKVHVHSDGCQGLICGVEAHVHKNSCFTTAAYEYDTNLWYFDRATEARVEPDGSTVIDVYFNRVEKTLTFNYNYSNGNYQGQATIKARWGTNIDAKYKAIEKDAKGSFWTEHSNGNTGPYTNYFGVMPTSDATYYYNGRSGRTGTMTYYGEDLNGKYQEIFRVDGVGGYKVSKEDRYEFEGYTYDHGTALEASCVGAKFYYTRNRYDLVFYSASRTTPDQTKRPLFQEPLAGYYYEPTEKPATAEPDAYFGGWYLNPECTGEQFDLSKHTMPAHNIALYAKWVNRSYTVTTYTSDSFGELYTYSGYTGSQKVEKYKLGVEPTPPTAPDGKVFVGWFYLDEMGTEKAFSFTMPITKDYNLYPKYSEKVMVNYTVHYYIQGTETKLADDEVKSALIGSTVTERAKMGTELNLAGDEKYFPLLTSTSVRLSQANMEIIFYYTPAKIMMYTVKYQDENGKDLIEPVEKTTDNSIVTETYVPIDGYTPRMYQQQLELSGDATQNVIIFIYDANNTWLKIIKSGTDPMEENQSFIFHVVGISGKAVGIDMMVTIQGYGNKTIDGLPLGEYKVTEDTDWSWRYTPDEAEKSIELTAAGGEVTFINSRTNTKWLSHSAYAVNTWTAEGGINSNVVPTLTKKESN